MVPAASESIWESELFSILKGPTPLPTPINNAFLVLLENYEGLKGLILFKGEFFFFEFGETVIPSNIW